MLHWNALICFRYATLQFLFPPKPKPHNIKSDMHRRAHHAKNGSSVLRQESHFLFVDPYEIEDFRHCGDTPGENIQQIQGRYRMKIGKYGVDPDYTEHAIQYENPMIVRRYIPAFITAASLVNRDKNALPKNTSDTPRIRPMAKEYARLMR